MSDEDAGLARRLINTFVKLAWERFYWPEMTPIEKRQFRDNWAIGTTYLAPTSTAAIEVYYPPAQKYYQSLQASTGQVPATLSGTSYLQNSAYWAESASEYSGNDWTTGTVYAVGDIVRNPDDDRFYQCITAHTAGVAIDLTQFGILTPFIRSLAFEQTGQTVIGEVRRVTDRDPRVTPNVCVAKHLLQEDYTVVRGCWPVVWVEFRKRPNDFSGNTWAAGTFAVNDQVYYDTTGNVYRCIAPATVELPTDTTKWAVVEFPYIFAEYVAQSVYATMMSKEEQMLEDFDVETSAGYPLLLAEFDKIERQQGQARQMNVINARAA